MYHSWAGIGVLVGGLAAAVGCYSPTFGEGVSCGANGECPTGQRCVELVCRTASKIPDSGGMECLNQTALLFTPSNFDVCDIDDDPPSLALTSATTRVNTDEGTLGTDVVGTIITQDDGQEALLISARSFSLAENTFLDVTGSRPLIIVSLADIEIDGFILSPGNLEDSGAGGSPAECGADGGGALGLAVTGGFTGGGGGGYGFVGGEGGSGPPTEPGVGGGGANGGADVVPLRGGCPGGNGGGLRGGTAGGGGGAIQLVAAGTVRFGAKGAVNVSGGGGRGGGQVVTPDAISGDGGGGGGAGGALLIEAGLSIVLESVGDLPEDKAKLSAAGGGGGGGAYDLQPGSQGNNGGTDGPGGGGSAGNVVGPPLATGGAGGTGGGGPGGNEGALGQVGTVDGALTKGGGGGGGAAGRIVLRSAMVSAADGITFPAPTELDL